MTFLSPFLGDTGTIFRIPQGMTVLHLTVSWVRTRLQSVSRLQRFGKKQIVWQRTADEQLPRESFQLFMYWLRPSCDTIGCYMHEMQLCPRGCYLIETASLIAKINLREWRASFFKRGIQNTIRRRAKSFHNLFY